MSQLANLSSVHLPESASVDWGTPHFQGPDNWVVDLEFHAYPTGWVRICFFGTEEQVRKIAAGHRAPEEVAAADPAQLDALDEATPEARPMTDLGAQVFELGVALNKIGTVASW